MASKRTAKTKHLEPGTRPTPAPRTTGQAPDPPASSSSPAGTNPPKTTPRQNPQAADGLPPLEPWMKQTVVLKLKEVDGRIPDMTLDVFGQKMVLDQGFSRAETLSVQTFMKGIFYITFVSIQVCKRYWEALKTAGPDSPFKNFTANSPIQREERKVTVSMRNPHTPGKDISTFLQRFCNVVKDPSRLLEANGLWNGKWSLICKLKKEPATGELQHLPANFALGNSSGILHYMDQPQTCNRCGRKGHMGKVCSVLSCRVCRVAGHEAKDCPRTKTCNLCGQAEHIYRDCPQRSRSYAGALIWGRRIETGPAPKKPPKKTSGGKTSPPSSSPPPTSASSSASSSAPPPAPSSVPPSASPSVPPATSSSVPPAASSSVPPPAPSSASDPPTPSSADPSATPPPPNLSSQEDFPSLPGPATPEQPLGGRKRKAQVSPATAQGTTKRPAKVENDQAGSLVEVQEDDLDLSELEEDGAFSQSGDDLISSIADEAAESFSQQRTEDQDSGQSPVTVECPDPPQEM